MYRLQSFYNQGLLGPNKMFWKTKKVSSSPKPLHHKRKHCSIVCKLESIVFRRDLEVTRPINELLDIIKACLDPGECAEPTEEFKRCYPVTNYHLQRVLQLPRLGDAATREEAHLEVSDAKYAILEATRRSDRSFRLHRKMEILLAAQGRAFCDDVLLEGVVHY